MPRKSTASNQESTVATPQKEAKESTEQDWEKEVLALEDFTLPRSVVLRLAKGVLPANTQIAKDAQTALWKSATVFVSYLASHANENSMRSNKKTIQPGDVFDAVRDLEFEGFLPRLEAELTKYNTMQCDKRNSYRRKIREEAKAKADLEGGDGIASSGPGAMITSTDGTTGGDVQMVIPPTGTNEEEVERATKKIRRSPGAEGEDEDDDQDDIDETHEEEGLEDEEMEDDEGDEAEEEEEPEQEEHEPEEKEDLLEDRPRVQEEDEAVDDEDSD